MGKLEVARAKGEHNEAYVMQMLAEHGDTTRPYNEYYDLEYNGVKIEVKSTEILVKNGGTKMTLGKFDFTSKYNRDTLRQEKGWVALVVTFDSEPVLVRFARYDDAYHGRYIKIAQMYKNKMLSLQDFVKKHQKKEESLNKEKS